MQRNFIDDIHRSIQEILNRTSQADVVEEGSLIVESNDDVYIACCGCLSSRNGTEYARIRCMKLPRETTNSRAVGADYLRGALPPSRPLSASYPRSVPES